MMIRNVSWASYYYDFWRSCDTEDWSNDAGNTAAHHRNKLQFTIYSHRKYFKILLYLSNKCSLGEKNKNTRTGVNIKLVKTRPVGFNFCFQNSYVIMMLICSTLSRMTWKWSLSSVSDSVKTHVRITFWTLLLELHFPAVLVQILVCELVEGVWSSFTDDDARLVLLLNDGFRRGH